MYGSDFGRRIGAYKQLLKNETSSRRKYVDCNIYRKE